MRIQALTYAQLHQKDFLADLQALLRIPSISTLPEHAADIERTAHWLAEKLDQIGLQNVAILPTGGHPMVYADWLEAGSDAPTLLIYGHYDVQPVDPLERWQTPPFEPTVKGDNIYGRGTADDKGQFYAHIAAVEAYFQTAGRLPLNIKFMLEGEEELGSPHLDNFVRENRVRLRADAALISDTHIIDPETPVLVTGVRGLVYAEIILRGSHKDLHSGSYGGAVHNPLNVMASLLAALHDEQGRVTIPGFYDDVQALTPAERETINSSFVSEKTILAETGAPALWGEAGYSVAERIGARPTLDAHGIKGGFIGKGAKTVIPAVVSAKVSMRLVSDQDPDKIAQQFTDFIHQLTPQTMSVAVKIHSTASGAMIDREDPAMKAGAEAYQAGFGQPPIYLREGGTLPVVAMFINMLNAPVVMMGLGLPDDGLHAPNEKFHLPNFYRGIETAIHFYDIFAQKK